MKKSERSAKIVRKTYYISENLAKKADIEAVMQNCKPRDVIEAALTLYLLDKDVLDIVS